MLRDIERCNKYQEAVERFKNDIKDKIVLDVGCGTGILSCFCAKAGAKKGRNYS
jgi:protein arginine N-methyltransferase 1